MASQATRQLNECPKNVKEALEWLEALGSGATACAQVIQSKILVNTTGHTLGSVCQQLCSAAAAFMNEIRNQNGGHTYPSSYQRNGWNQLCQTGGSTRCCQLTGGHGCRNCQGGGQCQGCCKNCPKQICARIFCLIVPVVYSALQCLLQLNGSYNNNRDSIQEYLRALGFNSEGVQQVLQVRQSSRQPQQPPPSGTLVGLLHALHSATVQINTALQNNTTIFVDGQSTGGLSISYSSTASQLTTPTSAKDLMLWTIFLPYCCNYQEVYQRLQGSLLSTNGDTSPRAQNGQTYSPLSPFDNLLYGLHLLFIGMEAGGQGQQLPSPPLPQSSQTIPLRPPSTLFDGINMVCQGLAPYEYYTSTTRVGSSYTDGTDQCCKLLIAGIAIISWAVDMLLQRNGGAAHGYGSGYGIGFEQALGFGGGTGMQQLSSTLGLEFYNYVRSTLEQVKTAYSSEKFNGYSSYYSSTGLHNNSYLPTTFREMLLWLQGLPCSGGYNAVRTLLPNGDSGRSSSKSSSQLNGLATTDPLVEIIFKLPYLFYHLEGMNGSAPESHGPQSNGTMTGYITELFQSQGIDVRRNGAGSPKARTTGTINVFSYDGGTIKKTFCAIVTVVYYVVDHLKRRYKGAGSSSLSSFGDSSGLLEFLGWDQNTITGALASGYGSYLNSVLQLCFGTGSGAATGRGPNGDPLKELFQQLRNALSTRSDASTTSTPVTPSTFRDTLLCLVAAPLTQEYESKKTELANAVPSRGTSNNIENNITDTIVGVLQLFHKLEGNLIDTVIHGVFGNGGTSGVSLKYSYKTESDSTAGSSNDHLGHSIFGASVVMRSVFGFLQQRCNRTGAPGVGSQGDSSNDSWHSCSVTCGNGGKPASTTTECKDNNHLCKFLCLLGWDHKTRGAQSTTTKDSASFNGTDLNTLLSKWFGSLDTTDQGVSSYTLGQSSVLSLKALYDCAVQWFQGKTEGATTTSGTPSSTTTPTTIRDMMLWLIGLPLHKVYTKLTKNGSNGVIKNKLELVKSRTSGLNSTYSIDSSKLSDSSQITNAILSSSQGMIITMLAIEGSIKSVWDFLAKGLKKENNTFNYGSGSGSGSGSSDSKSGSKDSDPEACFSLLLDYTYKVHYQLRFLLVMCNTPKNNGGWKECEYGNGIASSSSSSDGSSLECKCNGKSSPTGCPRPLYNFLNGGGANHFKNTLNGNGTSGEQKNNGDAKMGFSKITHTTTTGSSNKLTGSDIYALLKYYVDTATENNRNMYTASQPFSLLAQCIVAIGQRAPSTLGDCFELVWQLGSGTLYSYVEKQLKEELKGITWEVKGENKNKTTEGKLITAIQNLFSNQHTDHESKKSLMSLMCSTGTSSGSNSCAPYMKSLSQGLYSFYAPQITGAGDSTKFGVFQYLYDMLKKLLDKMKELKGAFDACECCKNTDSSKQCDGLIQCPYAHPILYKFGFVFGNPGTLKTGTSKKCENLKDQLDKVLSCTQQQESTLFKAFECVIQVTYSILLQRAKKKVGEEKNKWNGVKSQEETKIVFEYYVENAMYQSYPKLICTFACKVFDGSHQCKDCETRFKQQIAEPKPRIAGSTSHDITVSSTAVTLISPIIPQYTAPPIDAFHYRAFQKAATTTSDAKTPDATSTPYTFQSAIDFHVSGANCIRPTPVALRSVIDWILRVTVGDTKTNNSNDNITKLSEAIKSVFTAAGVTASDVNNDKVQQYVTDLVSGLRKFMGYEDRSKEVKDKVGEALGTDGNGVKGALKGKIDEIDGYLKKKDQFGTELGKALLKGRYAGTFKQKRDGLADTIISTLAFVTETITGMQEPLEQKAFKDVVELFTKILSSTHDKCDSGLNCKSINGSNNGSPQSGSGSDQNDGLKILKEFFEGIKTFNKDMMSLYNNKNGGGILYSKYLEAQKLIKLNGNSSINGDVYFHKLLLPFSAIAEAVHNVEALINSNNVTDSTGYRGAIQGLSEKLRNDVLSCLKDGTEKENKEANGENNNKADVRYAVEACKELIKRTYESVRSEITGKLKEEYEIFYGISAGDKRHLLLTSLINTIENRTTSKLTTYQSHLDDLKRLCQWLYRMGQLYAHGLKGFVESLIEHLKHIIEVICWIEKLHGHLKVLNASTQVNDVDGAQHAIPAKNIICKLLSSYVLSTSSDIVISDDKASTYRQLLRDLRLLALDRYTLQVWQDECNPKDSRQSAIKDWITFENGIVRHSAVGDIKQKLHELTGIDYNSTHGSSPPAPPSASHRIHNFHAICVIQKFSYEAPITKLEESLEKLQEIKDKLSGLKQKCDGSTRDVTNDTEITSFCQLVSQFLKEPYGIYSLAKFFHTILGPNIFSAVIAALEELKNKDQYNKNNGGNGNLDKIKGILKILVDGNKMDADSADHYTLTYICDKLESFITTLRKEYIFAYPVVTATATHAIAPAPPNPQPKTPTCPNRDHSMSSICQHCHPFLAKIFIGAIPNLYRHCRLLYEMCNLDVNKKATWNNDRFVFERNGVYVYNNFYLSLGGYMSRNGWIVKGLNEEMDKKELYELDPNGGGSSIYGNLYDVVSSIYPLEESNKDSLKPLDQLFKAVMQHFKEERKKKIEERIDKLRKAFEAEQQRTKSGLTFQAPPPVLPSTVRQVLFWLHEMDTNKAFYDAMSQHINTLCQRSSIDISHDTILHVLNLSITQCLEVLATIEDPGRQNADYYYELYTEEHYYAYPTVNIPLFFYTFVEKLMGAFLELNFVCVQCEFRATEGGWSECHIGKSEHSMEGQNCRCTKPHTKASPLIPVTVSGSVVCPRPLSAFLFSDQKNQLRIPSDVSQRLAYMSKGTMPCGFQLKNKAITDPATRSDASTPTSTPTSMTGSVLVEPLRKLVGGHVTGRHSSTTTRNDENNTLSTVIYLRDLLRYVLCLAVRPPWSMSENMAFFYRVTESWKQKGVGSVALRNDKLLGAIHAEIALFPGTFDGKKLTSAVERFAGIEDRNKQHGTRNGAVSPSGHHQYDLRTLMGCQGTNATRSGTTVQCSPFIFPLSLDVYTHYDHRNSRAYLSWILNFAFGIYGQLRGLEEMMKECVVKNASQCPSLPMCPGVLTALYQSGSSFMDQKALAKNTSTRSTTTTRKTCNEFHSVLTGLFNCEPASCSPLHNLIVQCEALLWSIRMPFSVVQLSLWSVAVLFISYVFVVPLDHFKIKSHLFNRLKYTMHPSLLITDQQRRVSEVAYFSL